MGRMYFPSDFQKATAQIEKVWLTATEYEYIDNYITIHVSFNTSNALGINGRLVAFFYYDVGNKKIMKQWNTKYYATDGHFCVSKDFSPSYINSTYSDFQIKVLFEDLPFAEAKYIKVHAVIRYNGDDLAWATSNSIMVCPWKNRRLYGY